MHLKIPQKTKDNPCFPVQSDDKIWKHSPHIGLHPSDKQHCQACGRFCIFCVCLMNSPAKLVGFPFSLFSRFLIQSHIGQTVRQRFKYVKVIDYRQHHQSWRYLWIG